MLILIAAILFLLIVFVLYCCCRASSRSERVIEAYHIQEELQKNKNEELQTKQ